MRANVRINLMAAALFSILATGVCADDAANQQIDDRAFYIEHYGYDIMAACEILESHEKKLLALSDQEKGAHLISKKIFEGFNLYYYKTTRGTSSFSIYENQNGKSVYDFDIYGEYIDYNIRKLSDLLSLVRQKRRDLATYKFGCDCQSYTVYTDTLNVIRIELIGDTSCD